MFLRESLWHLRDLWAGPVVTMSDTLQEDGGCCFWVFHHSGLPTWKAGGCGETDENLSAAQHGWLAASQSEQAHTVTGSVCFSSLVLKNKTKLFE